MSRATKKGFWFNGRSSALRFWSGEFFRYKPIELKGSIHMADRYGKVIGYFAFVSPTEVVCTGDAGDACVIIKNTCVALPYLSQG